MDLASTDGLNLLCSIDWCANVHEPRRTRSRAHETSGSDTQCAAIRRMAVSFALAQSVQMLFFAILFQVCFLMQW